MRMTVLALVLLPALAFAQVKRTNPPELSTPTGYEYLTETVWSTVVKRVPPGYELVVTRPSPVTPARTTQALSRAA